MRFIGLKEEFLQAQILLIITSSTPLEISSNTVHILNSSIDISEQVFPHHNLI